MPTLETCIEKIFALLESGEITIVFAPLFPGYDGWYDAEKKISIVRWHMSTRRTVETLVHACLHALYRGAPHEWVKEREGEVLRALSPNEFKKLTSFIKRRNM